MKNVRDLVQKIYGNRPEKVLQFGEGNFLRAFVDWMIDQANESGDFKGSIVLCQPIPVKENQMKDIINKQEGIYTVAMRGIEDGKEVEKFRKITSISRCINAYEDYDELVGLMCSKDLEIVVSNTTEAGITYKAGDKLSDRPASSFPAKIAVLLYERYKAFKGDRNKGLLFLPVELIDQNGDKLKEVILQYATEWGLPQEFLEWVIKANKFTNTLVDRIVTGYPKDQINELEEKLGYKDNLLVSCEMFHLWVIEGEQDWADIIPIHNGNLNVLWTRDVKPYKMRKVRILNGGHTATVLAAYLAGHDIVLDFMKDSLFQIYLQKLLYNEVIPTLPLPKEELEEFAKSVGERFANPYIKHNLLDIALNSCSKFATRCLPSLLEYVKEKGRIPKLLAFSMAALIQFYKGSMEQGRYIGKRADGTEYEIRDDKEVISFFENIWKNNDIEKIAKAVLSNTEFWNGHDLTKIEGLEECITKYLKKMEVDNMKSVLDNLI